MAGRKSKLSDEEKRLRVNAHARGFWARNKEAIKQRRKSYTKRQLEAGDMVHRNCVLCSEPFSYPIGRGMDRYYCGEGCRRKVRHKHSETKPICSVEGCSNKQAYKDGICTSCYYRKRRTGTLDRRVYRYRSIATTGYVVLWDDESHPLAGRGGHLYEHRKVLYDAIGIGPHPCHWCGTPVNWVKGLCTRGSLVPDHLDGDKANNHRSNLVPACNRCNANRGLFMSWVMKHRDDPFLWSMYEQARAKPIQVGLQQHRVEAA
jgi:hypothetical protein